MGSTPRWTRHIDPLYPSLEALFDAGEEVAAVVAAPGWGQLIRLLDAEIAAIDERLDGRNEPLTQAEYAMAHGRRSGLRGASEAAAALLGKYHETLAKQRQAHESADAAREG